MCRLSKQRFLEAAKDLVTNPVVLFKFARVKCSRSDEIAADCRRQGTVPREHCKSVSERAIGWPECLKRECRCLLLRQISKGNGPEAQQEKTRATQFAVQIRLSVGPTRDQYTRTWVPTTEQCHDLPHVSALMRVVHDQKYAAL